MGVIYFKDVKGRNDQDRLRENEEAMGNKRDGETIDGMIILRANLSAVSLWRASQFEKDRIWTICWVSI